MTHWYVGQKVVCIIPAHEWADIDGEAVPDKDLIYTIENIITHETEPKLCFHLAEIINAPRWYSENFAEASFSATWFRPLVDTNIKIFEKMLAKKPRKKSTPNKVDALT